MSFLVEFLRDLNHRSLDFDPELKHFATRVFAGNSLDEATVNAVGKDEKTTRRSWQQVSSEVLTRYAGHCYHFMIFWLRHHQEMVVRHAESLTSDELRRRFVCWLFAKHMTADLSTTVYSASDFCALSEESQNEKLADRVGPMIQLFLAASAVYRSPGGASPTLKNSQVVSSAATDLLRSSGFLTRVAFRSPHFLEQACAGCLFAIRLFALFYAHIFKQGSLPLLAHSRTLCHFSFYKGRISTAKETCMSKDKRVFRRWDVDA